MMQRYNTIASAATVQHRSRAERCNPQAVLTILHIVAPARVGGLERVVRLLAGGHSAAGHRVHVLAVVDEGETDHPFLPPLEAAGVEVHVLAIRSRSYLREVREVAGLCRRIRPDVVHTHGYRPDVVDGSVARWLGIPVVTTVHGFIRGSWKGRLYEAMQCRSYRSFAAVAAVSEPQVRELTAGGLPTERVRLVPNAWAALSPPLDASVARAQLGVADGCFHIGWVGRLSREKGADVLLQAVTQLGDSHVTVSVIGAGREEEALQALAAQLGIEDQVRWQGLLLDAGPIFPAFDVFVLSSRTEGTPIALFEAIEAGVPVVATSVGGVPSVVSDREALVVPSESPGAIAAAIRAVRADPAAARARSKAALARLRSRFGIEPWLARYEQIYREVQPSKFLR